VRGAVSNDRPYRNRILDINQLRTVTCEVVEAARESLVIGAT
jgi:hypothetical protein